MMGVDTCSVLFFFNVALGGWACDLSGHVPVSRRAHRLICAALCKLVGLLLHVPVILAFLFRLLLLLLSLFGILPFPLRCRCLLLSIVPSLPLSFPIFLPPFVFFRDPPPLPVAILVPVSFSGAPVSPLVPVPPVRVPPAPRSVILSASVPVPVFSSFPVVPPPSVSVIPLSSPVAVSVSFSVFVALPMSVSVLPFLPLFPAPWGWWPLSVLAFWVSGTCRGLIKYRLLLLAFLVVAARTWNVITGFRWWNGRSSLRFVWNTWGLSSVEDTETQL